MAVRVERQAEPIPGYKLIDRLGGGGFGEVWRCEAPGGLHKAIKFVFGDLRAAGDKDHRAEQELKALSRVKTVRHPYILSLERYDIIDGQLLIVMELADRNLWDRYKECRVQGLPGIPRDELLGYMKETAEALDLMNNQYQLQHLDIKPQNLFLVHSHVKVADFGLVKDLEGMQASVTGGVTPVYAAPETFDGWVSRFSDQYSLAIVFQELLTGIRPFPGTNVRQLILQHLQAPPNLAPLPPGDRHIIGRSLSKNPDQRYPQCSEMVEALAAATGAAAAAAADPDDAAPPSASHVVPPGKNVALAKPPKSAPTSSIRVRTTDSQRSTTPAPRVIEPLSGSASGAKPFRHAATREVQGDGVLFPALVIGAGGLGTVVLQRLRECLHTRFGSLEPLTNLRLLALDTDPEAAKTAMRGSSIVPLAHNDVFVAPLNRPSHYVKPREGKVSVSSWLNPRMVFRIPRNQVTTGVRALGRLAFCDHYRAVTRRLQADLEGLLDPDVLTAAAEQTGLGLRTNRPRVYILASLCGGTGGGMFLDLAYTARALLRRAGFEHPDVVGLLLVPAVDRNRPPSMGLGNAYAALAELSYFGTATTRFTARYHEREEALDDANPPFSRCVLLPLPEESDAVAVRELTETAGQYLTHDLCSSLGRAMDLGRAELSGPPWESRGQFYQTFGLFRLHQPRAALLHAVARQLCHQLIERWMSKDGKSLREAVRDWVQDQWSVLDLDIENFITRLQTVVVKSLGKSVESVLGAVAAPIAERLQEKAGTSRRGSPPGEIPPEEIADALREFVELLGKPSEENFSALTGSLTVLLRDTAARLAHTWGQKLSELPVSLIEDPGYRLAGAEEAVRHMVATIEKALQHHEPLLKDLTAKAAEAYARLRALLAPPKPGVKRYTLPAADILELLRCYPKWRYQSLVMQQVAAAFVGMRGHLSDELREINFCRVRLGELGRCFAPAPAAAEPGEEAVPTPTGRCLFPTNCRDLEEAVAQFLEQIGPDELSELDAQVEAVLKERFTALVNICLSNANLLKNVEEAMLETAEAFAAARLPETDVAQMFFERHPEEDYALAEVECFYGEAAPELTPRRAMKSVELCVLATPPGEEGDRFRNLFHEAMPKVELHSVDSSDDILLYRELSYLPLQELEQLGPIGLEAYRQMTAMENFTPHSRCDISFVSNE